MSAIERDRNSRYSCLHNISQSSRFSKSMFQLFNELGDWFIAFLCPSLWFTNLFIFSTLTLRLMR